ncbi:TPA: TraR/DksA family transcriptional regulator, partial [Escherichia coli]|nr:TraR/DksA family transcriptional regulator [Escherichia coli]
MADIVDNAAEIEELQRNLSLQKYKSDSNAPSAT